MGAPALADGEAGASSHVGQVGPTRADESLCLLARAEGCELIHGHIAEVVVVVTAKEIAVPDVTVGFDDEIVPDAFACRLAATAAPLVAQGVLDLVELANPNVRVSVLEPTVVEVGKEIGHGSRRRVVRGRRE